jgi:hypothetical protein
MARLISLAMSVVAAVIALTWIAMHFAVARHVSPWIVVHLTLGLPIVAPAAMVIAIAVALGAGYHRDGDR